MQCGHELKQETRFCTACGRVVAGAGPANPAPAGDREQSAREHAITATMTSPPRQDPPPREPVGAGPVWPGQDAHLIPVPAPGPATPAPATYGTSPASGGANRHSARRAHRWWPLVFPVAAVLAGGVTALIFLTLRPSHPAQPGAAAGHRTASLPVVTPTQSVVPSPASSSPAPPPTEQQAASSLAGLLDQSTSDRSSTVDAVNDVSGCGPGLSQDQQALENSAASRQQLLSKLASLPGRSALPAQMLQDLTDAWKESAAADQDLAGWAQDESSQGCSQDAQADSHYVAANDPDNQAKADKIAFVGEWNPIASQYGLTTYQWNQL